MDSPVALITAGSSGIGAATARLFAQKGMRVVINYNTNIERAQKLASQLHDLSPLPKDPKNFRAIQANLAERGDIRRLVEQTIAHMGRLDVVFSNGGWAHYRGIENLDDNAYEEDWDSCFNMNVKSHLFLMHAAKKYLDASEGAFITTASLAGVTVSGSSLAYSVTKAAQIHLAKGLAMIASPRIRVNTVSPGLIPEGGFGQINPPGRPEMVRQKTPLKRLATLEDVAEQVLCFVKSKSVTGTNAVIDGGLKLHL
ncbi:hypothetical protein F5884DRAFT_799291 [Xylogone sp. PMI_703]|nr:hypothetical protein F5884DRAFT_799291 [Xylogone sp. PMI_703]